MVLDIIGLKERRREAGTPS